MKYKHNRKDFKKILDRVLRWAETCKTTGQFDYNSVKLVSDLLLVRQAQPKQDEPVCEHVWSRYGAKCTKCEQLNSINCSTSQTTKPVDKWTDDTTGEQPTQTTKHLDKLVEPMKIETEGYYSDEGDTFGIDIPAREKLNELIDFNKQLFISLKEEKNEK